MPILGVDLGTTNTAAALGSEVLPMDAQERRILPSVVAFLPNGHTQTGVPARRRRAIDSENTIFSSKRIIGRRWSDADTQTFRSRYPFRLAEDEEGFPVFETRAGPHSPTRIAAILLSQVLGRVDPVPSGLEVNITVPGAFDSAQRGATVEAAAMAGLRQARLIDECLATAHAYLSPSRSMSRAVVYDLGGGTFDCAVVDCSNGVPRIVSQAGDAFLGGDDMDQKLAAWVATYVVEKVGWDLTNYSEVYDRLLVHCEEAKIQLSRQEEAVVHLSQVDPECPASDEAVVVRRSLLDELCRELVGRTFVTCDAALQAARMTARDVDAVLLAGGTTQLPLIQEGVEAYFGRRGLLEIDPTEVVARGASLVKRS